MTDGIFVASFIQKTLLPANDSDRFCAEGPHEHLKYVLRMTNPSTYRSYT